MEERNYLRPLRNSKIKKYGVYAGVAFVIIAVLFLAIRFNPFSAVRSQASTTNKTVIKDALATQPINKDFNFPLKDDKGETVGQIKYTIENAEIRDEIVIQGKKASAVAGRTFVILNLKITNDSSKTISMNTKDYVRLLVNGNEQEPLSPSIHNDPVVVDAISVKPTRIGFAINESDKQLKIKVGEIKGDKTTIDLTLK